MQIGTLFFLHCLMKKMDFWYNNNDNDSNNNNMKKKTAKKKTVLKVYCFCIDKHTCAIRNFIFLPQAVP